MKAFEYPILAALVLTAAACNKEIPQNINAGGDPAEELLPTELTIKAGTETKAYLEAGVIKWRTSDILTVFDSGNKGVDFTPVYTQASEINGKTTANFATESWTRRTPKYAAAYVTEYNEDRILRCESEGIIPVRLRKTQNNHSWKGCSSPFGSASVGIVEKNGEDFVIGQMKNVAGYIEISINNPGTKKIVVEAIGKESIAGWVNVDYDKLISGEENFWTVIPDTQIDTTVTITTSASGGSIVDGCFGPGKYYIAVLPQTYSKGLKFSLYNAEDEMTLQRTVGASTGIKVERSKTFPINGNVDVVPIVLPDEVVFDLDFTTGTNPLGFTDPGAAQEIPGAGENYPFLYKYADPKTGEAASTEFIFNINRTNDCAHYYYTELSNNAYGAGYVLVFDGKNALIKLPAVEGRYLASVGIGIGNGAAKEFGIKTSPSATSSTGIVKVDAATASGPSSRTIHFYSNGNDGTNASLQGGTTDISTPYYLHLRTANGTRITRLTVTYTKTLTAKP